LPPRCGGMRRAGGSAPIAARHRSTRAGAPGSAPICPAGRGTLRTRTPGIAGPGPGCRPCHAGRGMGGVRLPGGKAECRPPPMLALLISACVHGIIASRRRGRATHGDLGVRQGAVRPNPNAPRQDSRGSGSARPWAEACAPPDPGAMARTPRGAGPGPTFMARKNSIWPPMETGHTSSALESAPPTPCPGPWHAQGGGRRCLASLCRKGAEREAMHFSHGMSANDARLTASSPAVRSPPTPLVVGG
jgi:hypothetical protein